MEKVSLVIADIDNTLVEKHKDISIRTADVIKRLRHEGISFGLASGRSCQQLMILCDKWNIKADMLIGLNGSEIYDEDGLEKLYELDSVSIKEILEIMSPFDTTFSIRRNGISIVNKMDQRIKSSSNYIKNGVPTHIAEDLSEFYAGSAPKIGFRVSEEIMPDIEKRAAQFPSEKYIGFKTERTMFEFTNSSATKGNALLYYCRKHQMPVSEVWAFGDMSNDNDMLIKSGRGICMLNGDEETKKAADAVSEYDCSHDGFARYIEMHLWNHE